MDKRDLLAALVLAAFGLYVVFESARLPYLSEFGPGPGFLPIWLGGGIFSLALLWIVGSLVRRERERPGPWSGVGRALGVWLALATGIVLLPRLGFSLSLALLTFILVRFLEHRPYGLALAVSVGVAVGFHLVFIVALGLSLPPGPFGF